MSNWGLQIDWAAQVASTISVKHGEVRHKDHRATLSRREVVVNDRTNESYAAARQHGFAWAFLRRILSG